MFLNNYLSKIQLAYTFSKKKSFVKLLINSKKYSSKYKKGTLDAQNFESSKYAFNFWGKSSDILMRTYMGDIDIFYEIFWKKIYSIPKDKISNPKVIVDLGAHIGFTSIFYSLEYPSAKIFSVEASKRNYEVFNFNTKDFKNIKGTHKAIYSKDGFINFNEDGVLSYNTKINKTGTPIECISMQTLMEQNEIKKIDLLKIDIEGAESEILRVNNNWLAEVENIIIELHRPYDVKDLEKDLKPFGFSIIIPNTDNGFKSIFLKKDSCVIDNNKKSFRKF